MAVEQANGVSHHHDNDDHTTNGGDHVHKFRRMTVDEQRENPFVNLIPNQEIAIVPSFELESGVTLQNVPVAYKTYGALSPERDNAMLICHALTGSADVGDWWGPLLGGPGGDGREARAFDMSRFFIVCINSPGSPYGSASPVTARHGCPDKGRYGPEFPLTTIRDDVNLFKTLLDELGVKRIAAVIGGSMGGMLVLEFAYFGTDYVRTIIPIATSARYSAWGISWGEAQRQSIYSDPKYDDGYYDSEEPPSTGLGAARMSALLTYRSRDSFEARFGRQTQDLTQKQTINGSLAEHDRSHTPPNEHFAIHNEGHKRAGSPRRPARNGVSTAHTREHSPVHVTDPDFHGATLLPRAQQAAAATATDKPPRKRISTYYSAQSYLRYQSEKFIKRFDANCYIAITRKLDTHDVSRNRTDTTGSPTQEQVRAALAMIAQPALVLGIHSDGLFTYAEQQELAAAMPHGELRTIDSPDGHDAFLLEFRQVNRFILDFMRRELADIMAREPVGWPPRDKQEVAEAKASTFGEAEVDDITAW